MARLYIRGKVRNCGFRERISLDEYFDEQGLPKEDSIERLITDIDRGLWDSSFFWDIENYRA